MPKRPIYELYETRILIPRSEGSNFLKPIPALFSYIRIPKNVSCRIFPEGFNAYDTRGTAEVSLGNIAPLTIERNCVRVDFGGTIILPGTIDFGDKDYIDLTKNLFIIISPKPTKFSTKAILADYLKYLGKSDIPLYAHEKKSEEIEVEV